MKKITFVLTICLINFAVYSQVGINTSALNGYALYIDGKGDNTTTILDAQADNDVYLTTGGDLIIGLPPSAITSSKPIGKLNIATSDPLLRAKGAIRLQGGNENDALGVGDDDKELLTWKPISGIWWCYLGNGYTLKTDISSATSAPAPFYNQLKFYFNPTNCSQETQGLGGIIYLGSSSQEIPTIKLGYNGTYRLTFSGNVSNDQAIDGFYIGAWLNINLNRGGTNSQLFGPHTPCYGVSQYSFSYTYISNLQAGDIIGSTAKLDADGGYKGTLITNYSMRIELIKKI